MATKKVFQQTADILRKRLDQAKGMFNRSGRDMAITAIQAIAKDFAEVYAADNPRFDKVKFFEACGIRQEGMCPSCGKRPSSGNPEGPKLCETCLST